MKRVMLTVAYDGTNYHGWQIQPNGETIESVLNRCLSELLQESIEVSGASRTDAGVHALGNLAVFDTDTRISAEKIAYALNRYLPADIRIQRSEEVPTEFHPRYSVSRKTYEYHIYCASFPMPVKRLYAHFTYAPMNVDLMSQAAAYLVGKHDFKSFCSAEAQVENTVRRIDSVQIWETDIGISTRNCEENVMGNRYKDSVYGEVNENYNSRYVDQIGKEIVIRVSGRGFLYNMVRIIAGTLMEVGRGHIAPHEMEKIIAAKDRQAAGPTAPACGLMLVGYEFL